MFRYNFSVWLILFAGLFLSSCATQLEPIESDWTKELFFKNAQVAMDLKEYKKALYYYEVYSIRFPKNKQLELEAEYEIAFVYYKMGKLKIAARGFENILRKYKESPSATQYSPRFKSLAEVALSGIKKKQFVRGMFWRVRAKKWAEENDESLTFSDGLPSS